MLVRGHRISHFVKRDTAFDLFPLLQFDFIVVRVVLSLVSAPNVMPFDSDECSTVWTQMFVVSESPLFRTRQNWKQAAAHEAKCTKNDTHDV